MIDKIAIVNALKRSGRFGFTAKTPAQRAHAHLRTGPGSRQTNIRLPQSGSGVKVASLETMLLGLIKQAAGEVELDWDYSLLLNQALAKIDAAAKRGAPPAELKQLYGQAVEYLQGQQLKYKNDPVHLAQLQQMKGTIESKIQSSFKPEVLSQAGITIGSPVGSPAVSSAPAATPQQQPGAVAAPAPTTTQPQASQAPAGTDAPTQPPAAAPGGQFEMSDILRYLLPALILGGGGGGLFGKGGGILGVLAGLLLGHYGLGGQEALAKLFNSPVPQPGAGDTGAGGAGDVAPRGPGAGAGSSPDQAPGTLTPEQERAQAVETVTQNLIDQGVDPETAQQTAQGAIQNIAAGKSMSHGDLRRMVTQQAQQKGRQAGTVGAIATADPTGIVSQVSKGQYGDAIGNAMMTGALGMGGPVGATILMGLKPIGSHLGRHFNKTPETALADRAAAGEAWGAFTDPNSNWLNRELWRIGASGTLMSGARYAARDMRGNMNEIADPSVIAEMDRQNPTWRDERRYGARLAEEQAGWGGWLPTRIAKNYASRAGQGEVDARLRQQEAAGLVPHPERLPWNRSKSVVTPPITENPARHKFNPMGQAPSVPVAAP